MSEPLCLVIDDEPDILELLVMTLKPMGIKCCTATTFLQAKDYLQSQSFDLCLTDMRLPDGDGLELVDIIGKNYPQIPVAVITAHGNVETAVQALKAGAFDFISKPLKVPELRNIVSSALQLPKEGDKEEDEYITIPSETKTNVKASHIESRDNLLLSHLSGQSVAMQTVRAKIKKLARSQAPIYIRGESGTGKEVAARLLHTLGARTNKPFIPVNCGAIPAQLMESEFFGHKKGSFSDAYSNKDGLFQAAQGGTLFLDEIADLPMAMQVKLLRAIQEKQVRPVGSTQEIPVDVRILSATHRDLAKLVNYGKFRKDLFYRINVIELNMPALRERIEDIPELINNILADFSSNHKTNKSQQLYLSKNAITALQEYSFPGNVRELENILERAITLCENNTIELEDLQLSDNPVASLEEESEQALLNPLLDDVEKETILNALEQTNGNKTKAAKLLGISFAALRYRLKKFQVVQK